MLAAAGVFALLRSATACASATSPFPTPSGQTEPPAESTAAPTPDPVEEADALVLTTRGLGPLSIGSDPADSDLVRFDPEFCSFAGDATAEERGRWIWAGPGDFELAVRLDVGDGRVRALEVVDPAISTDRGVGVGSTRDELVAAYPDILVGVEGGRSSVLHVSDASGTLVFEVGADFYNVPEERGRVLFMVAVAEPGPDAFTTTRANTDHTVGAC